MPAPARYQVVVSSCFRWVGTPVQNPQSTSGKPLCSGQHLRRIASKFLGNRHGGQLRRRSGYCARLAGGPHAWLGRDDSRFGLDQSRAIEIWPAGLAPLSWDGENYGEWVETEPPRLGILSDHPWSRSAFLSTRVDTVATCRCRTGKPIFLELPKMPVGTYHLRVSAHNSLEQSRVQSGNLEVTVCIREEPKASSAINAVVPLSLEIYPRRLLLRNFGKAASICQFRA